MKTTFLSFALAALSFSSAFGGGRVNNGFTKLAQAYECSQKTNPNELVSEVHYVDVYYRTSESFLMDVYKTTPAGTVDLFLGAVKLDTTFFPFVPGVRLFNTSEDVEFMTTELPEIIYGHVVVKGVQIQLTCIKPEKN